MLKIFPINSGVFVTFPKNELLYANKNNILEELIHHHIKATLKTPQTQKKRSLITVLPKLRVF